MYFVSNNDQASRGFRGIIECYIQGTAMDTKKHAKMAAALETCKRLHEIGELNDRLLPEKRTLDILEDSEEEEEELPPGAPKPGTKRKRRLYQRRVSGMTVACSWSYTSAMPHRQGRHNTVDTTSTHEFDWIYTSGHCMWSRT